MSGDIFPMIRRMMKEIKAKEAKRTKKAKVSRFCSSCPFTSPGFHH
jgi:hypothetical protein